MSIRALNSVSFGSAIRHYASSPNTLALVGQWASQFPSSQRQIIFPESGQRLPRPALPENDYWSRAWTFIAGASTILLAIAIGQRFMEKKPHHEQLMMEGPTHILEPAADHKWSSMRQALETAGAKDEISLDVELKKLNAMQEAAEKKAKARFVQPMGLAQVFNIFVMNLARAGHSLEPNEVVRGIYDPGSRIYQILRNTFGEHQKALRNKDLPSGVREKEFRELAITLWKSLQGKLRDQGHSVNLMPEDLAAGIRQGESSPVYRAFREAVFDVMAQSREGPTEHGDAITVNTEAWRMSPDAQFWQAAIADANTGLKGKNE